MGTTKEVWGNVLREDSRSNFHGEEFLQPPWLPQEVSDVQMAFPASIGFLMPDPRDIPDQDWRGTEWTEFAREWFFKGLSPDTRVLLKEGIDGRLAFRHLRAIQGSFQPKHEHKEAAIAFLCALWFDAVETPNATYGTVPTEETK